MIVDELVLEKNNTYRKTKEQDNSNSVKQDAAQ